MGLCGVSVPPVKTEDLARSLEELNFSARTFNCLRNDNIKTVGDLVRQTEEGLLRMPNFGRHGLAEIKETLSSIGHCLGELPFEPRVVADASS
ncbi:MAG: DNA-directed RNA polymerase subunit alpha C-terminal domain-containing protein [Patescibacteria group bacterium]